MIIEIMNSVILATFFYTLFQLFSSRAAVKLSDMWFVILGGITTSLFSLILWVYHSLNGNNLGSFTKQGLIYLVLANFSISVLSFFLARSFHNFNASIVIPIVFGGAIAFSSLVNFLILKQTPTLFQILGIAMVVSGLFLLSFKNIKL